MSYEEMLEKYNVALESQPTEVKDLILTQRDFVWDENIQTLIDYLTRKTDQYRTYTHS